MSVDSEERERPEDRLRMLPPIDPPADLAGRVARAARVGRPAVIPLGPRVMLFLTVLAYLGWAFRSASLLSQ